MDTRSPRLLSLAVRNTVVALVLSVGSGYLSCAWGTDDVQVHFSSTIVSGTCQAELKTSSGAILTGGELAFGNVYISQVKQGTAYQNFAVSFSNCSGVKSATLQTGPGPNGLCNAPTFMGAGDLTQVAAEINQGQDGSGTQLNCSDSQGSEQTVDPNTTPDILFSARLVVAPGKTPAELKSGNFSAPVIFTIDYR